MLHQPLVRTDYFYETRRVWVPDHLVATRVTMGSLDYDKHLDGFKPYVYSGIDSDTLTDGMDLDEWGNVVLPPPPKPTKSDHRRRADTWLFVVRNEIAKRKRAEARAEQAARRRAIQQARIDAQRMIAQHYPEPKPKPKPKRHRYASPDWTPTTGADIDDLLAELGD